MRYTAKMLKKAQIEKYVEQLQSYLFVEVWLESKPYLLLKLNREKRAQTLGRVPKNILTWFVLKYSSDQPAFVNQQWLIFGTKDTPESERVRSVGGSVPLLGKLNALANKTP